MTPAQILLRWYKTNGRDLPWRHTQSAYAILVSEVMLQQTQVTRVLEFYTRWMTRFPDWQRLAQAKTDEVIHAWAGLGYNRRGLMLRSIAQHVVAHGEPITEADWLTLKGIGPYTAAALAAFSLHKRTLPIDTNVRRVLGRAVLGTTFPSTDDDPTIRSATQTFLPTRGRYYDVPQALFDLATSICTKTPHCALCPLKQTCQSAERFLSGTVQTPKKTLKKARESVHRNKRVPDRIYRGRILKYIRESVAPQTLLSIAQHIDTTFDSTKDTAWVQAMLTRLTNEGFLTPRGSCWTIAR